MATLSATLRQHRIESLVTQAEIVRDWEEGSERTEQATILIHEVMRAHMLGQMGYDVQTKLFSMLSFAMPSDYYVEQETDTPSTAASSSVEMHRADACHRAC